MRSLRGVVVAVFALIASAHAAAAQDATYTISGILAWTTAKTYAFEFAPERAAGESVTSPFDGMNTRLRRTVTNLLGRKSTVTIAQVVGGQPSVNPGERNTIFRMFSGRTLAPGWSVKSVDVGGNFVYVDQVRVGTSNLSFRVKLDPGKTATLRNVVLTGPAGADWRDAFSRPDRRDYVINGVVAWNAARKYGFQFKPDLSFGGWLLSAPHDGVFTVLYQKYSGPVGPPHCVPYEEAPGGDCILAQIAGGNLSVPVNYWTTTFSFTLYGGKKLAPGWKVKSVSISNGTFVRQPVSGSDDLSFVVSLTSSQTRAATAIIKSITLEGPSNATSFEDAFKYAP